MLLLALAMVVMSTTATSFFWFLGVDDLGHISLNASPHGAASCCLCYCSRFHCLFIDVGTVTCGATRAKRVRVPVVTESPQTCPPLHCRLSFSVSPPSHHHFRHDGPMCLISGQGHTRLLSYLPSPTISHAHGHGIRCCQAMGFDQRRSRLVLA